ncbi:unnamed protein product [Rhodiola kirilowii]
MAKRKAGNGGRKESGKVRKKGDNSSPNGSGKKSKGGGRDRKTGPRLPMALRKHIDLISSKREYEKEEEEDRSDGDEVLSDVDDVEVNNLYEYVAQKPQEELQMNRRFDPVEKVKMGLPEDFEDEDVPSDDEMVNGVSDDNEDDVFNGIVFGKEDDSDDEEDNEERHARMLNRVTNMPNTMFKGERKKNDVIISEVHPESEYNPTRDILEGDAAVTLEDLIGGFGNKSEYSKVRNRIKEMEKKSVSVHAPLPKPDKDKLERKVAYEHLKKEITKMESVVKRNREASTLYFDDNTNLGFSTVGAITCGFKPQSEFEKKMASIVHDARLDEAHRKDGSRLLELNKVSIEDERERQNRLAKMRSLLFKHEVKAKHIKKIKSKTYHRLNKKGKLNTLGDLHMDPESAKEQATKQEYKRAEERMTLKHKNTAKWAKRNLKRGLAIQDEGTRAAIAEQLHKHEILTRKMKSMNSDSSSDNDEEDEYSDGSDEGVSEAKLLEKAKQRIHKVLEEEDELPNSGVLSLPFMVRGLKKQQEAANEEARLALQDFEKSSNTEGAESTLIPVTNGRRVFGNAKKESQPSKRRAKPEVEYHSSDSEYEIETKDFVDSEHLDKPKDVNIDAAFFHEETDNNATSVFKNFKDIVKDPGPKTAFEVSILASKPVKKVKNNKDLIVSDPTEQHQENVKLPSDNDGNLSAQKSRKTVKFDPPEHDTEEVDEDNDTDSEGQMIEGMLSSGTESAYILPSQAELIRDAFAGDDVVDEFAKAKQEVLNEENPEPEEPKLVPGWGDWTQTQKRRGLPPWMVKEHEDAKKKREESVKKRKDSHLKHVIISEKVDKKAEKLYTKTLPFPHTSVGHYEQSIRMPLGPESNPASAVSELTRQDVMKRSGLIIQPLQYDDAIPYEKVEDSGHKPRNKTKSGKTSSVKPNSKRR